jgi:hypothetical protein
MDVREAASDGTTRRIALAAACVAFAARLLPIFLVPGIAHPDEIFQALEPAHIAVFGYGLDMWSGGLRSWIVPGVIAALMEASRLVGDGPDIYVPVTQIAFAALAASAVALAYLWAARPFGRWPALAAAALPALWPDAFYFAGRTLSEPVAAAVLVIALYLLEPGYPVASRRRLALGGALLALVFVIRLQLAPALAVAALWVAATAPRRRVAPLALGIGAMLLASGLLDWVTAGYPFAPEWRNLAANLGDDVASSFGTAPWTFYVRAVVALWGAGAVAMLALVVLGARRAPLLVVLAFVILAVHSLVPHKEYRFVYPAILLCLIVAGLGLAQLVQWLAALLTAQRAPAGFALSIATLSAGAIVVLWSLLTWLSPVQQAFWRQGEGMARASALVARLPAVCGVGTDEIYWWDTGGYTFFHRRVPFYWPMSAAQFAHDAPGFDTMIMRRGATLPPGYAVRQCFAGVCVAQRAGGCATVPMAALPSPTARNALMPSGR